MNRAKNAIRTILNRFFNLNDPDGKLICERLERQFEIEFDDMAGWISTKDYLPTIPDGLYGVSVLVATFDPIYEQHCIDKGCGAGHGYRVTKATYGFTRNRHGEKLAMYEGTDIEMDFKTLYIGGEEGSCWGPTADEVRFWMYLPDPPVNIEW